jgi:exosome complex component CSL4
MHQSFLPGDVIRCQIVSMGGNRTCHVSTARPELGVLIAESRAGEPMIPISWKEMLCPKTQQKELRKCAKPR